MDGEIFMPEKKKQPTWSDVKKVLADLDVRNSDHGFNRGRDSFSLWFRSHIVKQRMKKSTLSLFLISLILLLLTPICAQNRMVAEWEPMQGVLIRHPFGIPLPLIRALAEQDTVYILVQDVSAESQASYTLSSVNTNLGNCRFIIAPTNSHWTRDWGPHSIFLDDITGAIADPFFNGYPWVPGLRDERVYELDNAVNGILAEYLDLPLLDFPGFLTGGNFMTDGYGLAFSTAQMLNENSSLMSTDQFLTYTEQLLGIQYYNFTINPEIHGIQHIDCWAKLLNEETVLVKQLPLGHPEYQRAETLAAQFAQSMNCFGRPYSVIRIFCDTYSGSNAAAYTNSLILNKRVFVPLFGIAADQNALQTYADAMPGYEIIGFEGPWYYYDALHCRTMGIADFEMLRIEHSPLGQQTPIPGNSLHLSARIRSYGNHAFLDSSPLLYYRVSPLAAWQSVIMSAVGEESSYEAEIVSLSDGDDLEYYFAVADESGRSQSLPITAPIQVFSSTISAPASNSDPQAGCLAPIIYPLPTKDILHIRCSKQHERLISITLYNLKGQSLKEISDLSGSDQHSMNLVDLGLSSGVYLLRLHTTKGSYARRLLVVK
jgi:agmatine deiminase